MPSFELTPDLAHSLRSLSNAVAVYANTLKSYPEMVKDAIHRMARVSMIGASTRIENARLTDPEVLWLDTELSRDGRPTAFREKQLEIEDKLSKERERSIEEVAGCRSMLFVIYEQAQQLFPFRETYLRALHQELMQFYPPAEPYQGKYKVMPNSVIERNHNTGVQRVVFKTADPGPITEAAMGELMGWYNAEIQENSWSVAVACEFVFRFLAIHPFQDGNGRLGRGLFLLALLQSPDEPLVRVARYIAIDRQIERHKEEYYYVLQQCSGGVFHQNSREYRMELFLRYMIKILLLSLKDIDFYKDRYDIIHNLPDSAVRVWECFKDFPEKRLATQALIKKTGLPRRTTIFALNTLLKKSLVQKYGQGAGTRYQMAF